MLSPYFPNYYVVFHYISLGGKTNGDKVEYHPLDEYYLFHIKFGYFYVTSYSRVSKEGN